jgi:hypothetical protein
MLDEVVAELASSAQTNRINDSSVRRWICSDDTDVLGATYALLTNPAHAKRIHPPLSFDEVFDFMLRYYRFCMTNDPKSEWANSRYSAGWDLVGWFIQLWDQGQDKRYFERIGSLLADLYISGKPELKDCIEHAVLEHLFERKPLRRFFQSWHDSPELRHAYDEAMLWVSGGGSSPLTEK